MEVYSIPVITSLQFLPNLRMIHIQSTTSYHPLPKFRLYHLLYHCTVSQLQPTVPQQHNLLPTNPYAMSHTRNREEDRQDLELSRMKTEIEALKKEKELL